MNNDFKISVEENIPLQVNEILAFENTHKESQKIATIVCGLSTVLVMGFIAFCTKDSFVHFQNYEYILFIMGGFILFGFCYLFIWLVHKYDKSNWKKDKALGKSKLTSIIIYRDKTKYGEYFTFAGTAANEKIRIKVKLEDYNHYKKGAKIAVTYLKHIKEALEIIEI
jgi:hypothetical protein